MATIRIKYKDPNDSSNYIIEELDDALVYLPNYTANLHKTKLCNTSDCDGHNCKIWIEQNGEFVLAGIED